MLLAMLGASILGLLGVPLRARLLCLLALIAVYVPVTGAAPSIQRAGIMGAAGLKLSSEEIARIDEALPARRKPELPTL